MDGNSCSRLSEVTLVGTAKWLPSLARTVQGNRRKQLARIRAFLKLETARSYVCSKSGKKKCVSSSISFARLVSTFGELFVKFPTKRFSHIMRLVERI